MARLNALILSLATLVSASPRALIKCRDTQLRDSYDFIIAGGGTVGLTVADRLTEAFPQSKAPWPTLHLCSLPIDLTSLNYRNGPCCRIW